MEIEHNIFFDEFRNKLISLENSLLSIKTGEYVKEDVNEVFRCIHTIKGTADLLGMFDIVSISHKAEDLLEFVRSDNIKIDHELCKLFIEFKKYIALAVENVSLGIFDDSTTENLFIYFEKEFNHNIRIAEHAEIEYEIKKTILVIESTAIARYTIKKIAIDEGYNVLTSDNMKDGAEKIKNNAVDLLFCDFSIPNNKSLALVESLRIDFSTKELPIVMLLSETTEQLNKIGKRIGAKAWLKKPIIDTQLKLVLKKILASN